MKKIKFKAIRDVNAPQRDGKNAGYDLFVPKFTNEFLRDLFDANFHYFCKLAKCVGCQPDYAFNKFSLQYVRTDNDGKRYIAVLPIKDNEHSAAHYNIKIPSGILYRIEDDNNPDYTYCLTNKNKSGVASKNSVIAGACVMDMEYRDEAIVNLIGFKCLQLKEDAKMIQTVISRVETPEIEFIPFGDTTDIFEDTQANRGGGFNSTGSGL